MQKGIVREDTQLEYAHLIEQAYFLQPPAQTDLVIWKISCKMAAHIAYFFILHDLKLYSYASETYKFCIHVMFPFISPNEVDLAAQAYIDIFKNHDLIEDDPIYLSEDQTGYDLLNDKRWHNVEESSYQYAINLRFCPQLARRFAKENVAYLKAHTNHYDEEYIPHVRNVERIFTSHVLGREDDGLAEIQGERYLQAIKNHDAHSKLAVKSNLELMTHYYYALLANNFLHFHNSPAAQPSRAIDNAA